VRVVLGLLTSQQLAHLPNKDPSPAIAYLGDFLSEKVRFRMLPLTFKDVLSHSVAVGERYLGGQKLL
jgi:hypothetical protein